MQVQQREPSECPSPVARKPVAFQPRPPGPSSARASMSSVRLSFASRASSSSPMLSASINPSSASPIVSSPCNASDVDDGLLSSPMPAAPPPLLPLASHCPVAPSRPQSASFSSRLSARAGAPVLSARRLSSLNTFTDSPVLRSVPRKRGVASQRRVSGPIGSSPHPELDSLYSDDCETAMCPTCLCTVSTATLDSHLCIAPNTHGHSGLTNGGGCCDHESCSAPSCCASASHKAHPEAFVQCSVCSASHRLSLSSARGVHFMSACNHVVCRDCAQHAARDAIAKCELKDGTTPSRGHAAVECPVSGCGCFMTAHDVWQCFGDAAYTAIYEATFVSRANASISSGRWVRCPTCSVPIERRPPLAVAEDDDDRGVRATPGRMPRATPARGPISPLPHASGGRGRALVLDADDSVNDNAADSDRIVADEGDASGDDDEREEDEDNNVLHHPGLRGIAANGHALLQVEGKSVTLAALHHYSHHRLRCTHCDTNFCAECGEQPYHVGATCEQFKRQQSVAHCRFCDREARPASATGFFASLFRKNRAADVCGDPECLEKAQHVCHKVLSCGHPCYGVAGEDTCLPCLHDDCRSHPQNGDCADDFCSICYVDPLKAAASIRLKCGHTFHLGCVLEKLRRGWPGARITFDFMKCPRCNCEMSHPAIDKAKADLHALRATLNGMLLLRLEHEGLHRSEAVMDPRSEFYCDPTRYAMHVLAYYQCYRCKRPYFGGFKRCEAAAGDDEAGANNGGGAGNFDPQDLVCSACVPNADLAVCRIHGTDFIEYKCKFCCSVAQWYCWGSTHFCTSCHRRQERGDYVTKRKPSELDQCKGKHKCPLGVDHPPNGTAEFALGCALCRGSEGKNY